MNHKSGKGFSLVEVLLALSIGGLVLLAATALLVTISQAWANRPATRDAFDAHVNGVSHFLSAVLEEASLSSFALPNDQSIDLQYPVGFSDAQDPLIHFYLREAPPLFFSPYGSAVRVHAYLNVQDGEGLSILWFSELQELEKNDEGRMEPQDESELMKTLVSPFCQEIFYCYYGDEDARPDDIKEWEIQDSLEESEKGQDNYRIPAFIRLYFAGKKKTWNALFLLRSKDFRRPGWRKNQNEHDKATQQGFYISFCSCDDCFAGGSFPSPNEGNNPRVAPC